MIHDKPMAPRWIGAAFALAGLLEGCSFAPGDTRPPAPIPAAYDRQVMTAPSIARTGWHEFFPDPDLVALIGEALAYNRDVRIAAGRVEEARATYRIAGAALYPQLDATANGTRGHMPADLSVTGAATTGNQIYAQLQAGWEIDFWGRLHDLRAAARERYLGSEEARRTVAIGVIAQVATAYLSERESNERMELAHHTIATREDSLRILRRRYEVGSGSRLELTQAQTLLAQARTSLRALEQARDLNRDALAVLIGHPITFPQGGRRLEDRPSNPSLPAGLPSDLLRYRPDIVAAEHRLRAANADIGAARAAFFPNITLTGAYGTASAELDGLFKGASGAWSFSPAISLPIFQGGDLAARLDLARARRNIAVADYERTIQGAFRDVADALVSRRQTAAQIETMNDLLAALTERARLAQLRFSNGRSAYLEVLDAERDLFETQQALVQLRRAYFASGIALYAALGGGIPAAEDDLAMTVREERK